jgi:hypothetical protein
MAWGPRQWADGERRGLRAPLVCGVAGGVGTTTIAAALRARDLGVYHGGPADIIVCRSTSSSVGAAHRVVNTVVGKPVLVVVADGPLRTPAAVKARVRMVEPHVAALVWMPYVEHWRQIDQALEQAVAVPHHPESVPKWLRPWAGALMRVADAVLPLVDRAPSTPPASGVITDRPANGGLSAPPDPRAAVGEQSPGLIVVQGSRPSPPPAAAH